MIVASMIEMVISPRCGTSLKGAFWLMAVSFSERRAAESLFRGGRRAEQAGKAPGGAGVDRNGRAHAGAQRHALAFRVELQPHRDALRHLHPVAGGVLRRQQRELRAGSGADALDGRAGTDGPDRCRASISAVWPGFMWVSCVSLKFASTQVSPISTRLNSGVPAATNWPTLNEEPG